MNYIKQKPNKQSRVCGKIGGEPFTSFCFLLKHLYVYVVLKNYMLPIIADTTVCHRVPRLECERPRYVTERILKE